jgi:hypothetical protein
MSGSRPNWEKEYWEDWSDRLGVQVEDSTSYQEIIAGDGKPSPDDPKPNPTPPGK